LTGCAQDCLTKSFPRVRYKNRKNIEHVIECVPVRMNPEITIMIELQRLWDNVLRGREEIEKSGKSVAHWQNRIREAEDSISGLEKELNALDHERDALNNGRSALEDEILALMERLDSTGKAMKQMEDERAEFLPLSEQDISMLRERIARFEGVVKENSGAFEDIIPGLSQPVRARFQKAIQTGNGKAIARVEGEICEACHVKIPFHIVMDAAKSDKVVNCSHCGRFIYR
jgi:predicted  nucleic acid-binding Zn-ribbon protein